MNWAQKIDVLDTLGQKLNQWREDEEFLYRVESQNPWFIPQYTQLAIQNIVEQYLDKEKLKSWLSNYEEKDHHSTIGVITAGNIPLVGFHDILSAYMMGNSSIQLKISSKDQILSQRLIELWTSIDANFSSRLEVVERIHQCDKIIATGSNQTFKYFEAYFGKYKHVLRKNRTSIGVIHREITDEELNLLLDDVFLFFGLGCRNISKLWIERGFNLDRIFESSERYKYFFEHSKYMNNYDYQRTLLLLNKIPHLSNNFFILREDLSLFTPISVVHYSYYDNVNEIADFIQKEQENLQCVIGKDYIPFGRAQSPTLSDYADGVDTIQFLFS